MLLLPVWCCKKTFRYERELRPYRGRVAKKMLNLTWKICCLLGGWVVGEEEIPLNRPIPQLWFWNPSQGHGIQTPQKVSHRLWKLSSLHCLWNTEHYHSSLYHVQSLLKSLIETRGPLYFINSSTSMSSCPQIFPMMEGKLWSML